MNRKEAEVWASIPRKKLAVIAPNLDKHFDVLRAFANGAEIQFKSDQDKWCDIENIEFYNFREYRVKPNEMKPAEPWKPKNGEVFFYLTGYGAENYTEWDGDRFCYLLFELGNCFRNSEEVEAARERVRAALKGEIISKK